MKKITFLIVLATCIIWAGQAQAWKWGIAYSPVANSTQTAWTIAALGDLNVKWIRLDVHWALIEATEGTYNWTALDQRISALKNAGLKILVTLSMLGPEWTCDPENTNNYNCLYEDNDDFYDFVEALLTQYEDQIDIIQYGNEWNRAMSWLGTKENFVDIQDELYDLVTTYSPDTKVSMGSVSRLSTIYMLACEERITEVRKWDGTWWDEEDLADLCANQDILDIIDRDTWIFANADYDIVDIHLYDDPENWELYVTKIDELNGDADIICSEFGGPNLNWESPITEELQATRLQGYLDTLNDIFDAITDFKVAFMFKMVQAGSTIHRYSALVNSDLEPRDAYYAFKYGR